MRANVFGAPVLVRTGEFVIQEIGDLADAIDFLEEWPDELSDLVHEDALNACYDAQIGAVPMRAAEDAFVKFAGDAGILEDGVSALPWMAGTDAGGGRAPV